MGAERLEEEKASGGSFFDDRRSFVILRVAAGADISKSYKTSDRSELGLGRSLTSKRRKKKLPVEVFSTTGAVLLFCASARADVSKSYKTRDRSE